MFRVGTSTDAASSKLAPELMATKQMEKAKDMEAPSSASIRRHLLKGRLYSLPKLQSRVVRIFISSSFSGN